jgi:ribosomal protein S19E (S16A)
MADEGAKRGVTVRDVAADKFIAAYADVLKNNDKFVVPKWVDTVKTGVHKELSPYDPDWYYIRAGEFLFITLSICHGVSK